MGVIDESETSALATTILRTEAEDGDLVFGGLVEIGKLVTELIFRDIRPVWMEYVHDHLPPAEKGVANEFARPQSNGVVGHACGGRLTTDKPPEIRGRICVDMRAETLLGNVGGRSSKISN